MLTTKQRAVFTFLRQRIIAGTCPTIREIGKQFKITSSNGVICHLNALKSKGYITWTPHKKRTIRLLRERPTCPHCGGEL
jgi:repressor LexA